VIGPIHTVRAEEVFRGTKNDVGLQVLITLFQRCEEIKNEKPGGG
jgi:hypothetical protein